MNNPDPPSGPAASGPLTRRVGSDLILRVGSSLVLIPVALGAAWWGGWPAYLLVGVVAVLFFLEWALVVGSSDALFTGDPRVLAPAAFVAASVIITGQISPFSGIILTLLAGVVGASIGRSPWLGGGAFYAALFGVALTAIRRDPVDGLSAIVVLLVAVWAADSCAYFAGRLIGGPKLWPRVSPKKTWSGAIGGLVGGVGFALLAAFLLGVRPSFGLVALLVVLVLVSQAGDLAESALKRRFGRKDSSSIIPGHGGVLDRVDGLAAAGVVAFLVGWAHQGAEAIGGGILSW